jgi:hypothetical protein
MQKGPQPKPQDATANNCQPDRDIWPGNSRGGADRSRLRSSRSNDDVAQVLSNQVWKRVLARDPVSALRCGGQIDALPRGRPHELDEDVSFAVRVQSVGGTLVVSRDQSAELAGQHDSSTMASRDPRTIARSGFQQAADSGVNSGLH